jgi:hypothetical protein
MRPGVGQLDGALAGLNMVQVRISDRMPTQRRGLLSPYVHAKLTLLAAELRPLRGLGHIVHAHANLSLPSGKSVCKDIYNSSATGMSVT